jgi:hypothetical protein
MVNTTGLRYFIENVDTNMPENIKKDILDVIEVYEQVNAPKKITRNTSGVVQVDNETGKEIARFATKKDANLAIGKPEKASGISDAVSGRTSTHFAYGFKWYHVDEWDAMDHQ